MSNLNIKKMRTFEIGKTYKMNWVGDSDLKTFFTVKNRTEKTVTIIEDGGKPVTRRISIFRDEEIVSPLGKYSMSPILKAGNSI